MAERAAPKTGPKNDAEALRWLKDQHEAPCGDGSCDSVYCYVAKRMKTLASIERVMSMTHREVCIAWTEMGQEWDGQTSIQFARAIMVHRVLHPESGKPVPLTAGQAAPSEPVRNGYDLSKQDHDITGRRIR